ncbi:unnamed protein product [Ascophyllum nodosum]
MTPSKANPCNFSLSYLSQSIITNRAQKRLERRISSNLCRTVSRDHRFPSIYNGN